MKRLTLIAFLCLRAVSAPAVEPDEMLGDPALEARARSISAGLRCLVCRNESIDDSNAALARDLRLLVRERLAAGDSDGEAVAFIVARYGEYVLLKPQAGGANLILWLAGPMMLLTGGAIAAFYLRRRAASGAKAQDDTALSPDEKARLDVLLKR